jgi:hypothetical protein
MLTHKIAQSERPLLLSPEDSEFYYSQRTMAVRDLEIAAQITRREQGLATRGRVGDPMAELPDKLGAIAAAAAAFASSGSGYALIGGLAVGIRSGVPRATLDVDFAVPTAFDKRQIIDRFQAHAFSLTGEFAHSINFKHVSGEPVQLAFDPEFDPMIERAEALQLGSLVLYVVTTADLIAMKRRAAADPKPRRSKALRDQADIALLEGDIPDPNEGW